MATTGGADRVLRPIEFASGQVSIGDVGTVCNGPSSNAIGPEVTTGPAAANSSVLGWLSTVNCPRSVVIGNNLSLVQATTAVGRNVLVGFNDAFTSSVEVDNLVAIGCDLVGPTVTCADQTLIGRALTPANSDSALCVGRVITLVDACNATIAVGNNITTTQSGAQNVIVGNALSMGGDTSILISYGGLVGDNLTNATLLGRSSTIGAVGDAGGDANLVAGFDCHTFDPAHGGVSRNTVIGSSSTVNSNNSTTLVATNSTVAVLSVQCTVVGTNLTLGQRSPTSVLIGSASSIGDSSPDTVCVGPGATVGATGGSCVCIGPAASVDDDQVSCVNIGNHAASHSSYLVCMGTSASVAAGNDGSTAINSQVLLIGNISQVAINGIVGGTGGTYRPPFTNAFAGTNVAIAGAVWGATSASSTAINGFIGESAAACVAVGGSIGQGCSGSVCLAGAVGDRSSASVALAGTVDAACTLSVAILGKATAPQEVVFGTPRTDVTAKGVSLFHAASDLLPAVELLRFESAAIAANHDSAMFLLYKDATGTYVSNQVKVQDATGLLYVPV
jgi:hypothetical protein